MGNQRRSCTSDQEDKHSWHLRGNGNTCHRHHYNTCHLFYSTLETICVMCLASYLMGRIYGAFRIFYYMFIFTETFLLPALADPRAPKNTERKSAKWKQILNFPIV